jgi:hypothetical protein
MPPTITKAVTAISSRKAEPRQRRAQAGAVGHQRGHARGQQHCEVDGQLAQVETPHRQGLPVGRALPQHVFTLGQGLGQAVLRLELVFMLARRAVPVAVQGVQGAHSSGSERPWSAYSSPAPK